MWVSASLDKHTIVSSIRQWIDKSGWQRKMHTETSPLGRVIRSGLIPLNFQRDKSVHSAPFAYIGRERLGCKNGSRPFFVRRIRVPPPTHIYVPKGKGHRNTSLPPVRKAQSLFVGFTDPLSAALPQHSPNGRIAAAATSLGFHSPEKSLTH